MHGRRNAFRGDGAGVANNVGKKLGEKPRNDRFQVQSIISPVHCCREDK